MPTWEWVLADAAGTILTTLQRASGRSISWVRNGTPEAKFTVAHEDEEAGLLLDALRNGVPQLRAYRNDDLKFSGLLDAMDEGGTDTSAMTPTFRGPFGRLTPGGASGGRYTAPLRTFAQEDAGEIGWTLIDEAGADAPTGIRRGTVEATVDRDRTYERKAVGEAIVELTAVEGGFDFEVAPLDPTEAGGDLGKFNVYASQGADLSEVVLFEYGPETTRSVSSFKRVTTPPVNRVFVLGQNGLVGFAEDATSISRFGLYERVLSASDVSEQSTLDAKASAALRPVPVQTFGFTPDPALAPDPLGGDCWLGDRVRFVASKGALAVDVRPRLNSISVALGDAGEEAHTLGIDLSETTS